jgi:hypothetical protein
MVKALTQALVSGFRLGVALALDDAPDPSLDTCRERG